MSGHLTVVAAYLDLPQPQKLILMKICDSADGSSRIEYPGLDSLRLWSGTSKSRAIELLNDLQERGLLMQVDGGNRGHRASFKAFPDPGDEISSYSHKRGRECPGAALFVGSPGIPKDGELARMADERTATKPRRRTGFADRSKAPDPATEDALKGPMDRTQSSGEDADPSDPLKAAKGPMGEEKGSDETGKGSDGSDPFHTKLPTTRSKPLVDASAPTTDGSLFVETLGDSEYSTRPESGPTGFEVFWSVWPDSRDRKTAESK